MRGMRAGMRCARRRRAREGVAALPPTSGRRLGRRRGAGCGPGAGRAAGGAGAPGGPGRPDPRPGPQSPDAPCRPPAHALRSRPDSSSRPKPCALLVPRGVSRGTPALGRRPASLRTSPLKAGKGAGAQRSGRAALTLPRKDTCPGARRQELPRSRPRSAASSPTRAIRGGTPLSVSARVPCVSAELSPQVTLTWKGHSREVPVAQHKTPSELRNPMSIHPTYVSPDAVKKSRRIRPALKELVS